MAESELLVACAALSWAFKLQRKRFPSGREIPVDDYDFTGNLITIAKPFEMEFVVRSEKHAQRIRARLERIESGQRGN